MVSAGRGWGKTVTAAWWAREADVGVPVGWVSLDHPDNDLWTFWKVLLFAVIANNAFRNYAAKR